MAFSTVETTVVNPASRLGKGKKMAKRLSAKQIKYFGTKRQRAALKNKRRSSAKRTFKAKHRKRTNPPKRRAAPRKTFHAKRRKNPGEIISFVLGNPARRKQGKMAKSFKKKASSKRTNAGRPRKVSYKKSFSRHRHRNPALGRPMDWVKGGVGVLAGVVVTRALPQAVAATYNTGATGYALNAGTALAAAYATHALTKDPVLTASVAAGGFAALIARIISDLTPYGSALALTGVGDYQFSNIVGTVPQRIANQGNANMEVGWSSAPYASPSYNTGADMGRRAGQC